VIKFVIDLSGRWFSPDPQVSSTNKTDHHDITEILLKVALNTTKKKERNKQTSKQTLHILVDIFSYCKIHQYLFVFRNL
jgi:hypothetical protein